jgi:hypothetical protein
MSRVEHEERYGPATTESARCARLQWQRRRLRYDYNVQMWKAERRCLDRAPIILALRGQHKQIPLRSYNLPAIRERCRVRRAEIMECRELWCLASICWVMAGRGEIKYLGKSIEGDDLWAANSVQGKPEEYYLLSAELQAVVDEIDALIDFEDMLWAA